MSNKRIIALLEDQLKLSAQREKSFLEQLHQQSIQIEELTASIRSLEEALLILEKIVGAQTAAEIFAGTVVLRQAEGSPVVSPEKPGTRFHPDVFI